MVQNLELDEQKFNANVKEKKEKKEKGNSLDLTHQSAGNPPPWREIALAIPHSSKSSSKKQTIKIKVHFETLKR